MKGSGKAYHLSSFHAELLSCQKVYMFGQSIQVESQGYV